LSINWFSNSYLLNNVCWKFNMSLASLCGLVYFPSLILGAVNWIFLSFRPLSYIDSFSILNVDRRGKFLIHASIILIFHALSTTWRMWHELPLNITYPEGLLLCVISFTEWFVHLRAWFDITVASSVIMKIASSTFSFSYRTFIYYVNVSNTGTRSFMPLCAVLPTINIFAAIIIVVENGKKYFLIPLTKHINVLYKCILTEPPGPSKNNVFQDDSFLDCKAFYQMCSSVSNLIFLFSVLLLQPVLLKYCPTFNGFVLGKLNAEYCTPA